MSFHGSEKPVRKPWAIDPVINEPPNAAKLKKRETVEAGTERSIPLNSGRSDFRIESIKSVFTGSSGCSVYRVVNPKGNKNFRSTDSFLFIVSFLMIS